MRVVRYLLLAGWVIVASPLYAGEPGAEVVAADEQSKKLLHAEAEFLEGLHYSNAEFARLYSSLPRDDANRIDWEKARIEQMVEPVASIEGDSIEEKIFDLRVVIKFDDMLIKNVVFSHAVHTYWLDCSSCHPKLFIPKVDANKMTMREIHDGKYCGKCHGAVAFPTQPHSLAVTNFRAVCKRCHRERR
jgi:c(7)-type cytochrome triheme protein